MSLFRRGQVWWSYLYLDGVRHQQSTGATSKRQAQEIESKFKQELIQRKHQLVQYDHTLTVAALIARFLADGDPKEHHLCHFKALLPFFGHLPVTRLNRNMAKEFRGWRKQQKTLTDATVNRSLSVLRHILYWAVDEQLIASNPMARLPLVQERRLKRPVMTLAEEEALLAVAPDYLKAITICALDSGMRRGEILRQRWEDVDLSRKLLMVSRSKTAGGEGRELPLTDRLFGLLSKESKKEGIVFTFRGLPLSWIRKGWLGALKRGRLRHFRFHDMRHTFNTRLMEAGVIQDVRMALMGHSGGSKVHSMYTHVELPIKRQAIAQLQKWVRDEKTRQKGEMNDASTKDTSESVEQDNSQF